MQKDEDVPRPFCFCIGIGFPVKEAVHPLHVTAAFDDSRLSSAVLAHENPSASSCHVFSQFFMTILQ